VHQEFEGFFFLFRAWLSFFFGIGRGGLRVGLELRDRTCFGFHLMLRPAQKQEAGKHREEDQGHHPEGFDEGEHRGVTLDHAVKSGECFALRRDGVESLGVKRRLQTGEGGARLSDHRR